MSDTSEKESEIANITVDELNDSNFENAFSSTIVSVQSELDNTLVEDNVNNENRSVLIMEQTFTEENNSVSKVKAIDDEEINLLVKAVEESVADFDCDEHEVKDENTIKSQNNCEEVVSILNIEKVNMEIVERHKRSRSEEVIKTKSNDGNLRKKSCQQSGDSSIEHLNNLLNETVRSDVNYSRDLFQNDADKSLEKSSATEVECGYNPDYFNYVNRLWGVDIVPDPHRNVTKRFLHNTVSEVCVSSLQVLCNKGSKISLPVNSYLQQRIGRVEEKIIRLNKKFQALNKNGSTQTLKNKVLDEIEELNRVVMDMKRDQSEVKRKFEFYKEPYAQKNANFLTTNCVQQLTEQEQLIDFQKKFYH